MDRSRNRRAEDIPRSPRDDATTGRRWIPIGLAVGLLGTLGAMGLATVTHRPIGLLTRDVTTLCAEAGARLPPYAGSVSELTVVVWTSVATAALVTASLLRSRRRWLLGFAALLALLSADDALSLHEESEAYVGLPELGFYLVYAVLALTLTLRSLQAVRRGDTPLTELLALVAGGSFLALSLAVDQLTSSQHLAEDGPKLIGACIWAAVPLLHLDRVRAMVPASVVGATRPRESSQVR